MLVDRLASAGAVLVEGPKACGKTAGSIDRCGPAKRHSKLALRILQALARNIGMNYDYLERLMVLDPLEAWSSNLRSRARLRTPPRVQFCDPSLAVAARRTGAGQLLADLNYFGYLFEGLVVRDLRVFANALDGTVQHYRDSDDLEIDAVVTSGDGRWAAFEVKLGQDDIDMAAANLLALRGQVDTTRVGEPPTLAVSGALRRGRRPRRHS